MGGYATTFINKSVETGVLLDLKHLLIEAKQKVPPFIATLESEEEKFLNHGSKDDAGCSYCGGLGHRITACPKLEAINHKKMPALDVEITWLIHLLTIKNLTSTT